jgi:hypothetical protein
MDGYWTLDRYPDHFGPAERDRLKEVLREAPKGKDVVLFEGTSLTWHPKPDSLDAAWAEAEAALGDRFEGVRQSVFRGEVAMRWVASWSDESGVFNFYGPTPAAALHALTTEMRGHRP